MKIAVAGKGGSGKTTFAGLMIYNLLRENKTPILAVDADPNSNLDEFLGIKKDITIADIRESAKNNPPNIPKTDYINYKLNEAIIEQKGFDFISMGRPEGSGCYCLVNELLRTFLSKIYTNYNFVIMDMEAGLEHLSRRTTDNIDKLFILTEPFTSSIETAKRIRETAKTAKLKISEYLLVINKGKKEINIPEIKTVGYIPYDMNLAENSEKGGDVFRLSENNPAALAVKNILKNAQIL